MLPAGVYITKWIAHVFVAPRSIERISTGLNANQSIDVGEITRAGTRPGP